MRHRWLGILIIVFIPTCSILDAKEQKQAHEFVITSQPQKKKKLSINTLKENIGTTAHDAFNQTTSIISQIGTLEITLAEQQEKPIQKSTPASSLSSQNDQNMHRTIGMLLQTLATIQTTLSQALEKLINDQKPFKKAGRADLERSLTCVTQAHADMASIAQKIQTIHKYIPSKDPIKKSDYQAQQDLEQQKNLISAIQRRLATDSCFKRT